MMALQFIAIRIWAEPLHQGGAMFCQFPDLSVWFFSSSEWATHPVGRRCLKRSTYAPQNRSWPQSSTLFGLCGSRSRRGSCSPKSSPTGLHLKQGMHWNSSFKRTKLYTLCCAALWECMREGRFEEADMIRESRVKQTALQPLSLSTHTHTPLTSPPVDTHLPCPLLCTHTSHILSCLHTHVSMTASLC